MTPIDAVQRKSPPKDTFFRATFDGGAAGMLAHCEQSTDSGSEDPADMLSPV